jgi:hypothetical protein
MNKEKSVQNHGQTRTVLTNPDKTRTNMVEPGQSGLFMKVP